MLIEAVDHPIRYRFPGGEIRLEPGRPVEVEPERAAKLLARAGAKVRAVEARDDETGVIDLGGQTAPLHPGWLVVYRDRRGTVCGGCDDRLHGTVQACRWDENGWTVSLTDGQRLPLSSIRSVGQTDDAGQIVAAWTV
jgi:hypothetical protein